MSDHEVEDPYERLAEVNRRAEGTPIPEDFRPLELAPEDREYLLRRYDLPEEPAAGTSLYTFWKELFSPPLSFHHGDLSFADPPPDDPVRTIRMVFAGTRQQSSLNWSGASINARDGRMFTDVLATWKVPKVDFPEHGDRRAEYKSSCWVGLDGQRAYFNSTLPQIGTEQGINKVRPDSGPHASVWVQWWPLDELTIRTLPVVFGDRVYCWLTATEPTRVRCIIKVVPTAYSEEPPGGVPRVPGRLQRFYLDSPKLPLAYQTQNAAQARVVFPTRISGATAQWITEAPTSRRTKQIFPLPKYTPVTFEQCHALSATGPGRDTRLESLIAPTLSRIYKIQDNRRVTVSVGTRPSDKPELNEVVTQFIE